MELKKYRYRKHIRWMQYLFGISAFSLLAYIIVFVAIEARESFPEAVIFAIFKLIIPATQGAIWYLFYRMAGITVAIRGDTLVYATRSGTSRIPLENITRLEFPSIKYTGGWIKIVTPDKTIRLTVVIEDISEFLLDLKEVMSLHGLSDRYDKKKFFQFLKTATYSDQSWARLYRFSREFTLYVLLIVLSGIVFGVLARLAVIKILMIPVLIVVSSTLVFMGAEYVLGRKFAKATDEEKFYCPAPDLEIENIVYRKAAWIGGVLCILGIVSVVLIAM